MSIHPLKSQSNEDSGTKLNRKNSLEMVPTSFLKTVSLDKSFTLQARSTYLTSVIATGGIIHTSDEAPSDVAAVHNARNQGELSTHRTRLVRLHE